MDKPVIAITMGDPAGIGPELVLKVLANSETHARCRPLVIGDPQVLMKTNEAMGAGLDLRAIEQVEEACFGPPTIDVLRPADLQIEQVPVGKVDPAMGRAAILCLREAYRLAMAGKVHGVAGAPINKQAMRLAGYPFHDELEYLIDLTGSAEAHILGVVRGIWTAAVTEHVPFKDIAGLIKKESVLKHTRVLYDAMRRSGVDTPRIAVAALNAHAGEGGQCGTEEIEEIGPAIEEARKAGIDAQGPCAADTVFVRATAGEFDGVVCMYHDQANIARKLLAWGKGATLFVGLPVVYGTTAHGTAFDKAGQWICDPGSLQASLEHAASLARGR